jgi:small subunit ribosomal protein S5
MNRIYNWTHSMSLFKKVYNKCELLNRWSCEKVGNVRRLSMGVETLPSFLLEKWNMKFEEQKKHPVVLSKEPTVVVQPSENVFHLFKLATSHQDPTYHALLGQSRFLTRHVLDLRRTVKVTEGGKVYSYRTCVAVGNKRGEGGIGFGKSLKAGKSIEKAYVDAMKRWTRFNLYEKRTILQHMKSNLGVTKIELHPTLPNHGLCVHKVLALMCRCFGIKDISGNVIGRRNHLKIAKGFFDMLVYQNRYKKTTLSSKKKVYLKKDLI